MENYVTEKVKALIGFETHATAWDAIERGAIRRFAQAIMDDDRIYWDDEYVKKTKYGTIVTPPLYLLYAFRQPPGTEDPLNEAIKDPNYHGSAFLPRFGLPEIPIPFKRFLNGGNDVEFFAYAKLGDRVSAKSRILDIYQKQGRSGPMVFIEMENIMTDQDSKILLINHTIEIRR